MNDKPYITDSYMLRFLEQKLGIKEMYLSPIEVKDDLPYLQYIYQHLKEVWYGLMIAELREQRPEVDEYIAKNQLDWNKKFWGSVFFKPLTVYPTLDFP